MSDKKNILLVEDNEISMNLFQRILKKSNYSFISASDGVEALELYNVQKNSISLILTDIRMPNMGGNELTKNLRGEYKDETWQGYSGPIIAFTASKVEAQEALFDEILCKPVKPKGLIGTIQKYLN